MVLLFNMESQVKTNWCWAATSKSVSQFYRPASTWTQCSIAAAELSLSCCATPFPGACNIAWYLDRALARTGNYVNIYGPLSYNDVEYQLGRGLVLGARVGWRGGGGHFMVIHGTSTRGGQQFLHIDDPIYGKSVLLYNQFLTNYQGSGNWTHTYLTKVGPNGKFDFMRFKNIIFNKILLKPVLSYNEDPGFESASGGMSFTLDTKRNEMAIPHYAFVVGLDQIRENAGFPNRPGTLRLFDTDIKTPFALFEVTLDEVDPELVQVNMNSNYLARLEKSLATLKNDASGGNEPAELRLVKFPALNLEAYWAHYDKEGNDLISPINLVEGDDRFDWNKIYSKDEFWAMVRDYAGGINPADDLLGG